MTRIPRVAGHRRKGWSRKREQAQLAADWDRAMRESSPQIISWLPDPWLRQHATRLDIR